MADNRELGLGVRFYGAVDSSINAVLTRVRGSILGIVDASSKYGGAANTMVAANKKLHTSKEQLNKQISHVYGGIERLKAAMKVTAAYSIAGGALFGVVSAMKSGVLAAIEYDQALKNLQAISGATSSYISGMGDSIEKVAARTKFSVSEISEGMVLLAQSGFSATEAMNAIGPVADLATGTLSDLATVSNLVTTTIRAFGLESIEAGRVADVMANAINKSKLTVEKLNVAFNFVGAAAAQAGLSIEETAATMMILANNGLRASTIGTGFRQVLAKMISPSEKLREAFAAHGIELEKINPLTVGYQEAMTNLAEVLWDTEKGVVDMGKAFEFFQLRGAQAAAIISKSFKSGDFQKALESAYEVGSAAEMAAIQAEGLGVKFKNLADRAGILAIKIGKAGLTDFLRDLVTAMQEGVQALGDFADTLGGKVLIQTLAWSAALGSLTYVLTRLGPILWTGLISGVTSLLTFLPNLTRAISVLTLRYGILIGTLKGFRVALGSTGIGLVIIAISTLIGYLVTTSRAAKDAAEKYSEMSAKAEQVAETARFYGEALDKINQKLKENKEGSIAYADAQREMRATLLRAAQDVEGLKEQLGKLPPTYDNIRKALRNLEWQKPIESILDMSDAIINQQAEVDRLVEDYGSLWKQALFLAPSQEEVAAATRKLQEQIAELVIKVKDQVRMGKLTVDQGKELIESYLTERGVKKDLINQILTSLIPALEEERNKIKETATAHEEYVDAIKDKTPKVYEELYKKLGVLRQMDLVDILDKQKKELEAFKKKAKDMYGETAEYYKVVQEFEDEQTENFMEEVAKRHEAFNEGLEDRVAVYEAISERLIAEVKRQVALEILTKEEGAIRIAEIEHEKVNNILKEYERVKKGLEAAGLESTEVYKKVTDEIEKINVEVMEGMTSILEKTREKQKKALEDQLEDYEESLDEKLSKLESHHEEELLKLEERFQKGLISEQDYNVERENLETQLAANRLQIHLEFQKELLLLEGKGLEEFEKKYAEHIQKLRELQNTHSREKVEDAAVANEKIIKDAEHTAKREVEITEQKEKEELNALEWARLQGKIKEEEYEIEKTKIVYNHSKEREAIAEEAYLNARKNTQVQEEDVEKLYQAWVKAEDARKEAHLEAAEAYKEVHGNLNGFEKSLTGITGTYQTQVHTLRSSLIPMTAAYTAELEKAAEAGEDLAESMIKLTKAKVIDEYMARISSLLVQKGEAVGARVLAMNRLQQEVRNLREQGRYVDPSVVRKRQQGIQQQYQDNLSHFNMMINAMESAMGGAIQSLEGFFKKFNFGSIGFSEGGFVGSVVNGMRKAGDTVAAWLNPEEYIIKPEAVKYWGKSFLDNINNMSQKKVTPRQIKLIPGMATGYETAGINHVTGDTIININHPDSNEIIKRVDQALAYRAKCNRSELANLLKPKHKR